MRTILVTLSLSCLLLVPGFAYAEGGAGAIDAFRTAHADVRALVDAKADAKALQREVDALLDYGWIAQAALGGPSHYAARCGDRCDEFEARISELIRRNYLKTLHSKNRGKVEILAEHVREAATKVDTQVTFVSAKSGTRKTVEVDYVMHEVEGTWRVRDIITDDVSLARTYKYEINKLYKEGGMDQVLSTLDAKLVELDP